MVVVANLLPLLPDDRTAVAFGFTAEGADWSIDDVCTAGEGVPLAARIVAVADAFSAITTTRSYRRAQSPERAVEELRRCAGAQSDPKGVDAVVVVLARSASATGGTSSRWRPAASPGGARDPRGRRAALAPRRAAALSVG